MEEDGWQGEALKLFTTESDLNGVIWVFSLHLQLICISSDKKSFSPSFSRSHRNDSTGHLAS